MQSTNLQQMLRSLHDGGVEFILVGGLAAVLNGAPVHTYDVDIVHARDAANIGRLIRVLEAMDAIFRLQPERRLKPNESHLCTGGHLNLLTRYGPLDVLGSIGSNLGYEDLIGSSRELAIGEGIRVRVLNLETLIAIKEELGGEKDQAVLPVLRQTLAEIRKRAK
jgi:predicted nucleotidyltransferase